MKKYVVYLAILTLILTFLSSGCKREIDILNLSAGDTFTFGLFEQDSDFSNGKEPIEWIVLSVEKDRVLLLSSYILTGKYYYRHPDIFSSSIAAKQTAQKVHCTWDESYIRNWLNTQFIEQAFSEDEKPRILYTTVMNNIEDNYNPLAGKDTQDQIFLLSAKEIETYNLIEHAPGKLTKFSEKIDMPIDNDSSLCSWWLRNPGYEEAYASDIGPSGRINQHGTHVSAVSGVRPAMWIQKDELYKPSGTITPLPTSGPTKEPTLTPVPKITDLFDHRVIETIEIGDLFSFGTRDWGKEVSKTPDDNSDFIWKVVDFTGTEATLILNEDFSIIRDTFANRSLTYINPVLLNWLNTTFFNETFKVGWSHMWMQFIKQDIETAEGVMKYRVFILDDQHQQNFFGTGSGIDFISRPAIKVELDRAKIQNKSSYDIVLEQFIYRLLINDLDSLLFMLGAKKIPEEMFEEENRTKIFPAYSFLKDVSIENIRITKETMKEYYSEYQIEIDVSKSGTTHFVPGTNLWDVWIGNYDNSINYFRPSKDTVKIISGDSNPATYLAYQYGLFLAPYSFANGNKIEDFNTIFEEKYDSQDENDKRLSSIVSFIGRASKSSDYKITVPLFLEQADKILGIKEIDFKGHRNFNENTNEVGYEFLGGYWMYASEDYRKYGNSTKTYEIEITYYSDSAYYLPALTLKFHLKENPDGSLRILSVEKIYDSGLSPASGST